MDLGFVSTHVVPMLRTLKMGRLRQSRWYIFVLLGILGLLLLVQLLRCGPGRYHQQLFAYRAENLLLNSTTSVRWTVHKREGPSPTLLRSYLQRLESLEISPDHINVDHYPCLPEQAPYCFRQPCTATFPPPEQRLKHILSRQYPVEPRYRRWIEDLADKLLPKDVVFITAVSANHFPELTTLLEQLAEVVFPELRDHTTYTFKLLCYDLGMTAEQIEQLINFHVCTSIIKVPLHELPESFMDLRTCAWKPLLIQANAPHSKVTVWMDSSVRFKGGSITSVLRHAFSRGLFVITPEFMMPEHFAQEALRYFDVDPCLLSPFSEMAGGFIAVHNDEVMRSAVLDPWVACAFSPDCLCPGFDCYVRFKECWSNTSSPYSHCHRFDQATLGLITAYLFDWRVTAFYGGGYDWGQDVVDFSNLPNNYSMTPKRRLLQN